MPFVKGQSGNPGGRSREKPWRDAINRAVKRHAEGDLQALDRAADKLVLSAIAGDMDAMKEIGDRLDGKPAQAIIGGDENDPPVNIVNRVELVDLGSGTDSAPTEA